MRNRLSIVRAPRDLALRSIYKISGFGFRAYDLSALPDRLYADLDAARRPPSLLHSEAEIDVEHLVTPAEVLTSGSPPEGSNWSQEARRAVERLEALWLITEDRYRLLDAAGVEPLAHQASLVEHIIESPDLDRVLIADEVGLGKTVEAALIIKRLAERATGSVRTLYLTEARLVAGVCDEFRRAGLRPREWSVNSTEARLVAGDSDPLVIASIHKAVVSDTIAKSGPWDVLIIDEAHHLTDWSPDGTDPAKRLRLVRGLIKDRLVPGGRIILMTGTPHQGSEERFRNLLALLSEDGDSRKARGRIIYRIKDDITDWDGSPLFPNRQVNPPTEVAAGDQWLEWMALIHDLLSPENGSRAAGWRRAQALQFCASSPQAGLAYVVRLALRVDPSGETRRTVDDALQVLRPYRGGAPDEPIEQTLVRLRDVGNIDTEGGADDDFDGSARALRRAIQLGVELIQSDALGRKLEKLFQWMNSEPDEKFVVFAQPVDTVYALLHRVRQELGPGSTALIVGAQDDDRRKEEIRRFRTDSRCRVLISSRAGGEGINLQTSRRLVHFDVPWNPMELEQRVGRVHRYGSVDTVIVDTLVLAGSREKRVLERARARLGKIIGDLDRDRLELLYSRTMSLIPLDELTALMAGENFGSLTGDEADRIDRLVAEGYSRWRSRDEELRRQRISLEQVERGIVRESDFASALERLCGADKDDSWSWRLLRADPITGRARIIDDPAEAFRLPSGRSAYIGRPRGVSLIRSYSPGRQGDAPVRVGLNDAEVAAALRSVVGGANTVSSGEQALVRGAGALLISRADWLRFVAVHDIPGGLRNGFVLITVCARWLDRGTDERELRSELKAVAVSADGGIQHPLSPAAVGDIIRSNRQPRPRRTLPEGISRAGLIGAEDSLIDALRPKTPNDNNVAVFPVAALWLEPADS